MKENYKVILWLLYTTQIQTHTLQPGPLPASYMSTHKQWATNTGNSHNGISAAGQTKEL